MNLRGIVRITEGSESIATGQRVTTSYGYWCTRCNHGSDTRYRWLNTFRFHAHHWLFCPGAYLPYPKPGDPPLMGGDR